MAETTQGDETRSGYPVATPALIAAAVARREARVRVQAGDVPRRVAVRLALGLVTCPPAARLALGLVRYPA
jgi:hypothetical protein